MLAPLSTLSHWLREFEGWTDFNAIVYHGSNESRELIREREFKFSDSATNPATATLPKFQVLITSYEVIRQDLAIFKKIRWRCVGTCLKRRPAASLCASRLQVHGGRRGAPAQEQGGHFLTRTNCGPATYQPTSQLLQDSALAQDLRLLTVEHTHLLSGTPLQARADLCLYFEARRDYFPCICLL